MKEIAFQDLKNFSSLPENIISSSDKDIKYKTKEEILREFNIEKWSKILNEIKNNTNATLNNIDQEMEEFDSLSPFLYKSKFYLATGKEKFEKHLELYKTVLDPYIMNASSLVELGAGYGSKILNLSNHDNYKDLPLYAAEYTVNGCEAIKLLSERMDKKIKVGYCDLKEEVIKDIDIPKDSVIFTSYAAHYVQKMEPTFIDFILEMEPKIIINFEPCYENHSSSKFGDMCRRYIELNDYNTNMITLLENSHKNKKIELEITENVIGSNPFLPISIIKWHKAN